MNLTTFYHCYALVWTKIVMRRIMISSDGQCSISRYAGIGRQPLPINPLKEILKKEFLVATKQLYKRFCLAIRPLASWFFFWPTRSNLWCAYDLNFFLASSYLYWSLCRNSDKISQQTWWLSFTHQSLLVDRNNEYHEQDERRTHTPSLARM